MILDLYEIFAFARKSLAKQFPYLTPLLHAMTLQEESEGGENFSVWSDAAGVMHFNPEGFDQLPEVRVWGPLNMERLAECVTLLPAYTPETDAAGEVIRRRITVPEMSGVLLHECLHIIWEHILRAQTAGASHGFLWNLAADLVIHSVFEEASVPLLPGCVTFDTLLPEYRARLHRHGHSVEAVYEVIKDCPLDREMTVSMCGRGQHTHTTPPPPEVEAIPSPEDTESPGPSLGPQAEEPQEVLDLAYANLAAKVEETLNEMEKYQGTLPGALQEMVKGRPRPTELPWHLILRARLNQALRSTRGKSQRTYKKPSRRRESSGGLLFPRYTAPKQVLLVVIDTSGSVSTAALTKAWEELSAASSVVGGFWLMECDARIRSVVWVRPGQPVPELGTGRGGTSFIPPFEAYPTLLPRPSVLVYFTDGEGYAPVKAPVDLKTFWVIDNPLSGSDYYPIFPGDRFGEIIKCH